MSKTVFEKWIEVEEKSVDDNYILEYYLSQKTKRLSAALAVVGRLLFAKNFLQKIPLSIAFSEKVCYNI